MDILEQEAATQAKITEQADHTGCFRLAEAAKIIGVQRETIRNAIETNQLQAHRAPGNGPTTPWHIDLNDLRALYAGLKRRRAPGAGRKPIHRLAMSTEEAHEFLGAETLIASDPTEWAEAKRRTRQNARETSS